MGLDELEKRLAKDHFVGKRLGQVLVDRWMAEGQTGTLYFGHHEVSKKEVVVRVLWPEMTKRPGAKEKLLYEIRIAQQINHPNVVRVVEAGEVEDSVYVAMEFVRGEPLEAVMRREGRLDFDRATHLIRDIALGLEAAHDLGLIHRDLRPPNVLMGTEGHPKINNFGLARPASTGSGRTQIDDFLGPPHFLSPEQVEGKVLDAATDQYSLGVIYFTMLTGEMPFEGVNDTDIARARLKEDLPVVESLPLRGQQLLAKLTARSPRERFPGTREVVGACERALYGREETSSRSKPKTAPPPSVQRRERPRPAAPKAERHGLTVLAGESWVPPTRLLWSYFAFLVAAAAVAASAGMRREPAEVRAAFLASAIFPTALGATLLLKQRTGWRGVLAILLGAGALGLMFYGLSIAESWPAVASRLNALALGAVLVLSVAVSVVGDFESGAFRRLLLLAAFALVAVGAGAFHGVLEWVKGSPTKALPALAVTTIAVFCAVFLLASPKAGRAVRAAGLIAALVAVAGLAYAASGGNVAPLGADLEARTTHHGTAATGALFVAACAHGLLKSRA